MVVSVKANKKRILAFLLLAVIVVGACLFLRGGPEAEQKEILGGTEEQRVAFLQSFGWQVEPQAAETREVMIPAEFSDVYTAYNAMQKAQGFDLEPYAGQVCTQYKYKITNYPEEDEVYATLLVQGDLIIGGDVACGEIDGFMHGFAPDSARYGETGSAAQESQPEVSQAESAPGEGGGSSAAEQASQAESPASQAVESTAGEPLPEEAYPTD